MWAEGVNGAGRPGNGQRSAGGRRRRGCGSGAAPARAHRWSHNSSTASPITAQSGSNQTRHGRRRTTTPHNSASSPTSCCPRSRGSTPPGLAQVTREWQDYIDHIRAYGYNGRSSAASRIRELRQSVTGHQIYPKTARTAPGTRRWSSSSGTMWKYADEMGMQVVFRPTCWPTPDR